MVVTVILHALIYLMAQVFSLSFTKTYRTDLMTYYRNNPHPAT